MQYFRIKDLLIHKELKKRIKIIIKMTSFKHFSLGRIL